MFHDVSLLVKEQEVSCSNNAAQCNYMTCSHFNIYVQPCTVQFQGELMGQVGGRVKILMQATSPKDVIKVRPCISILRQPSTDVPLSLTFSLSLSERMGDLLCGVWGRHDCATHNGYCWRIGCLLCSEQLTVCVQLHV